MICYCSKYPVLYDVTSHGSVLCCRFNRPLQSLVSEKLKWLASEKLASNGFIGKQINKCQGNYGMLYISTQSSYLLFLCHDNYGMVYVHSKESFLSIASVSTSPFVTFSQVIYSMVVMCDVTSWYPGLDSTTIGRHLHFKT